MSNPTFDICKKSKKNSIDTLLIAHEKTCTTRQLVFATNLPNSALKFPSQQGKKTFEKILVNCGFHREKQHFHGNTNSLHRVQFLGKADARHPLVTLVKRYTQSSQCRLDFRPGRERHNLQKRLFNERENSVGILFLDDSS